MVAAIGRDSAVLRIQRTLEENIQLSSRVSERLASGLRINRASDDAAGLAVVSSLKADARLYTVASRNINDGISALSIAGSSLDALQEVMNRVTELATQAANGVLSNKQREALNTEANALMAEATRIVRTTKYNGQSLLNGSFTSAMQVGVSGDASSIIQVAIPSLGNATLGDGTFSERVSVAGVSDGDRAQSADINNDGYADLLFVSAAGGIRYTLSNGDGTFGAVRSIAIAGFTQGLVAEDFNGDGNIDLAAHDSNTGTIRVYQGTGTGSFSLANTFSSGILGGFSYMSSGDFNGDGRVDLVTNWNSGTSLVWTGAGNGTFSVTATLLGGAPMVSATGDIGTGVDSILTGDGYLFTPNGDGSFRRTLVTGGSLISLSLADINGDGKDDVISVSGGTLAVRLSNGDGTFRASQNYSAGTSNPWLMDSGDFNSDGFADVAIADSSSPGKVAVLLGSASGTMSTVTTYGTIATGVETSLSVAIGDFNGDGALDMFTTDRGTNALSVFFGEGEPGFARVDLTTQANARSTLQRMSLIRTDILEVQSAVGASMRRLEVAMNMADAQRVVLDEVSSRIMDADMASEVSSYVRLSILRNLGGAMLAQAQAGEAATTRYLLSSD